MNEIESSKFSIFAFTSFIAVQIQYTPNEMRDSKQKIPTEKGKEEKRGGGGSSPGESERLAVEEEREQSL